MEAIIILLLIAAVCLGIARLCDLLDPCRVKEPSEKGSSLPKTLVTIMVVLLLGYMLIGSCSSFLDDAGSSDSFTLTTAEEAASQYYYDSDGHIRMKN